MEFTKSNLLNKKFNTIIPGGAHTYAKGDDQYPEYSLPYIMRGEGCHVWDLDGNEFVEYGMGLRSVTLGHAHKPVIDAAQKQMLKGSNFVRPAAIELECADELLSMIVGAEMVKFAKNGSDATNGAIRLSRAYTGRDMVAICADHPFFSIDDWFMGTTPMSAGIPNAMRDLTVQFHYNDIESVKALFKQFPNKIACVILEPEKEQEPVDKFLHELQKICRENGTVFVLDEMITGFRWHNGGAQRFYDITPDLSTFGKGMGNGFSVSALAGKKDIMRLGGLEHDKERVFLLSLTQGAETHCLAAAMETMRIYKREPVIDFLWRQGERLKKGIDTSIDENKLNGYVQILGKPCNLVCTTSDLDKKPSQPFRTLLMQETIKRGILAPSLVVSYSHTDSDIDRTIEVFHEALGIYRKALDDGVEKYLIGRPVKPVWRKFN
ncbi:MAG: glutamate-1-semialdehyde 2,1-aminomutase [Candidatus Scalindua sp. AMX11]|nr:MAG: glutamate-1-semialdehyde 2,1-aminomutase [Candidatus Scalindua sp.]NOG82537.1 glutamate-1-semialdehyde 2,1-aminomutase [Planctomycetota bacterium]RZV93966.1 MAG: glutamate-1-semialdehyde 2,1-aminomutase [Candidatus Scalindua sp. SCAELEC01]TDE63991.1 MAG: glutamate-1-semialdehyde 2,1-aminomutase [Candidatus Scalindua sp. AMX11]GJQ58173.1 MAG: glutamate-1-semialdehyde 2,1-aminomutase [Candidatus Scalindua sp.]